ncbi:ribonuclease PH [Meiothermus hypogaeus]|uniref:Ribonuclease PH n=2 Tax=Meiothermus hypogaeus TaxID=884155 RepID=A0A511R4Q1_9DEIN|nr:ribonuclease PH [Meiothermus hypogaeus]RIH77976.1 Ribonuclease PH [Meiothermus hypogaeus]GEM84277.1 ribonuclease PH [Meiothermus hypogaeus NBRC 106114]GIW36985.1 MAG: ribonuclease PH [Meiothermus sp.]
MKRKDGRTAQELRPLTLRMGYVEYAEGSALVELGNTRVLVNVSLAEGVPRHVSGREGWLMAEYNLLPRSTKERKERERQKISGRTAEIQRFLGRAFRAALDLSLLPNKTVVIDADVLQADGGTRVASLLGGYAALHMAMDRLVSRGKIDEWPLTEFAAVSVGWMADDSLLLDLTQVEDENAWADLTVVATRSGDIIELHGAGEGRPVPKATYQAMLELGLAQIPEMVRRVHGQLKNRV